MKRKASSRAWKNYQSSAATSKRIRLGLFTLLSLAILILLGKLFNFIGTFEKPFAADVQSRSTKAYSWNGRSVMNMVFLSKDIYVVSLDPKKGGVIILKVPTETYLDLPHGFGRWKAGSIYDLGQQEEPPFGAVLLKDSATHALGIPIGGYVIMKGQRDPQDLILSIHRNLFFAATMLGEIKTDFTPKELIHIYLNLAKVRPDKLRFLDLGQSQITKSALLPDGTRALVLDQISLDKFITDKLEDTFIKDEGISVGVFNSTTHPGLGEKVARMITNIGGRVIFVANAKTHFPQSIVVTTDANEQNQFTYTKDKLSQVFAPSCLKSGIANFAFKLKGWLRLNAQSRCDIRAVTDVAITTSRAQVNVILGEDYYTRLNSR